MGTIRIVLILGLILPAAARAEQPRVNDEFTTSLTALPVLRGTQIGDLSDNVVIVTFFASWCPPCHDEFRHLRNIKRRHDGKPLRIIAINIFETWIKSKNGQRLNRFLEKHDPPFTILQGTDTAPAPFGPVNRIPTVFIFNRDGKLAHKFIHETGATKMFMNEGDFEAVLAPLLK